MTAKERHEINLLKYLGDPEMEFPKRKMYHVALGVTKKTLYKHFTPLELTEIESKAIDIRKKSCNRQRANVLSALYERAIGFSHPEIYITSFMGNVTKTDITKVYPPDKAAAQEFLDRTEGKVLEKKEIKVEGKDLAPILNVTLSE